MVVVELGDWGICFLHPCGSCSDIDDVELLSIMDLSVCIVEAESDVVGLLSAIVLIEWRRS